MLKDVNKFLEVQRQKLQFFLAISKKQGFVIESSSAVLPLLQEILAETKAVLHVVPSTNNELTDYVNLVNKAELEDAFILSDLTRERYLVLRDFNKRTELGKDVFPFVDIYASELEAINKELNIDGPKASAERLEAEQYVRLSEKLTGQVSGESMYNMRSSLSGTPLGSEEVLANLEKYGKLEASTRDKFHTGVISVQIRGPGTEVVE